MLSRYLDPWARVWGFTLGVRVLGVMQEKTMNTAANEDCSGFICCNSIVIADVVLSAHCI